MGRFAPSPTGPLHFGSLLAATASYLEARVRGGRWLLRIDNIDPPREQAGASDAIVATLEHYGFEWDGPTVFQADSQEAHEAARDALLNANLAYRCRCSRRDLADEPRGPLGTVYPGTCRKAGLSGDWAIRVRTYDEPIRFDDGLQGPRQQQLESESGDFVIYRRDGLVAYHLAVAVDDARQGVTHIVRGIDLMDSTPRQIHLQQCLTLPTPDYQHIPVAVHDDGDKLSKLTGTPGIPEDDVSDTLSAALAALQHPPPEDLGGAPAPELWAWAIESWDISKLRGLSAIPVRGQALAGR